MKVKISKKPQVSTHIVFKAEGALPKIHDFAGAQQEQAVRYENNTTIIYCGIGKNTLAILHTLRTSAAAAVRTALKLKRTEVALVVPSFDGNKEPLWKAVLEGALMGAYTFNKYKSEKSTALSLVELVGESLSASDVKKCCALCDSVAMARDLVNDNAHVVYPEYVAKQAKKIAAAGNMTCTVLNEKELTRKGLNLLLAVGQASLFPPRLVIMEYRGNPQSKETTAIIGKGITFDSGGQNLKPTGSIETMRTDMAGAAAVLGTMQALSIYKPKINVVGLCCLAHNAIGSNAFFPGDIYTSYSGKTVEINSTDAEGRLVLADTISYCKDIYKPSCIIDLATLTGAIIVALGTTIAGLFSNNKNLSDYLFAAGERTNERLWPFPLYEEFTEAMQSSCADLRNTSRKKKGWAGSITGGAFIKEFVGDTPWAHIDIAGTAYNEDEAHGEIPQGATGFGVRLLIEYLTTL